MRLSVIPTRRSPSYLIDHKGVIRHKWVGGAREKVIENAVEELIQEASGPEKKAEK